MHRRTNSYSYTASDLNKVVPPPLILSKKLDTQRSEEFIKNTEERRSYRKNTSSLSANKGYRTLGISQAQPALIRFSVNFEDTDMHRPRSPVKTKGGKQSSDAGHSVPSLDNALAEIQEQLMMMKMERTDIVKRIDTILVGINKCNREIFRQRSVAQRGTSQSLRRIHSLEGRSYNSYTNLPTETPKMNESNNCLSSSNLDTSPSIMHRRDSLPSNSLRRVQSPSNTSGTGVIMRNNSLSKHRGLPTIHDADILNHDDVDNSSSDESQASPKVAPISPAADRSISTTKSPSSWSKSSSNSYYSYTLPYKRPQSPLYSTGFIDNSSWDKASLTSADSMILQVSSATGQLEKVPKYTRRFSPGSMDNLDKFSCHSRPLSNRFSVSSYFIGPGFEDTDGMIMKLSEEPGPQRSTSLSSSRSSSISSTQRNSLVLINSKETTV